MNTVLLAIFLSLTVFAAVATGDICARSSSTQHKCIEACTDDTDCPDPNKECLCDGDCGKSCVKKFLKCPAFVSLKRGQVVSTGNDFNDTASFVCNFGFTRFGSETRRCRANGEWDGKKAKCRKVCKDPGTNSNSQRYQSPKQYFRKGQDLTYYCNPNFVTKDNLTLTCQNDGKWSSKPPVCLAVKSSCGPLIIPPNTVVSRPKSWKNASHFQLGTRVVIKCQKGYRNIGTLVRGFYLCRGSPQNSGWLSNKFGCVVKSCRNPGTPINGRKRGLDYSIGKRVYYSCNRCYKLDGPSFRTCQANAKWTLTKPSCRKTMCSAPPKMAHGNVRVFTIPIVCGTIVQYRCDIGYNLKGPKERKCLPSEKWSGKDPQCEIVDCGDPGVLKNGKIDSSNGLTYSQDILFACDDGYFLDGSKLATCQADGRWSRPLPKCLAKCSDPKLYTNANVVGNKFYHGESLSFLCLRRDYRLVPNKSRKLKCHRGKWNGEIPTCKAPCNALPIIKNSPKRWYSRKHGDTVGFSCNFGYSLYGALSAICNDGSWSNNVPQCLAVCRRITNIRNGQITFKYGLLTGKGNIEGDELTFTCRLNYRLVGERTIKCQSTRYWTHNTPQCKAPCQALSQPRNGRITKEFLQHGGQTKFECDRDYVMQGDAELSCDDGRWKGRQPSCLAPCARLDNAKSHKRYVAQSGFRHGENIRFGCQGDYVIVGKAELRCNDGKWSGQEPSCAAPCRRLVAPFNGRITHDRHKHGETTRFTCNYGYKLTGHNSRRCDHGQWSGNKVTTCEAVVCPKPGVPRNGMTNGVNFTFGNTVSFSCNNGYVLVGDSIATCQADRIWSGRRRCLQLCPDPTFLTNAQVNGNDFYHGQTIRFRCSRDHSLEPSGRTSVMCRDGQWIPDIPQCKAPCPMFSRQVNGKRYPTQSGFRHGEVTRFACPRNHVMVGNASLRCIDGQWDAPEPWCAAPCLPLPAIANGRSNSSDTRHGSTVGFSCWNDHDLIGSRLLVCNDSRWSHNPPRCVPRKKLAAVAKNNGGNRACPDPTTNTDADTFEKNFSHGMTVTFFCQDNSDVSPQDSRHVKCNDGIWDKTIPTCKGNCPNLHSKTNARFQSSVFHHGVTIKLSCSTNQYDLKCDDGSWNNPIPFCGGVCVKLQPPKNGYLKQSDNRHGGVAEFACNQGYRLLGRSVIGCRDGLWGHQPPTCEQ